LERVTTPTCCNDKGAGAEPHILQHHALHPLGLGALGREYFQTLTKGHDFHFDVVHAVKLLQVGRHIERDGVLGRVGMADLNHDPVHIILFGIERGDSGQHRQDGEYRPGSIADRFGGASHEGVCSMLRMYRQPKRGCHQ
jgi:hypothetical protein